MVLIYFPCSFMILTFGGEVSIRRRLTNFSENVCKKKNTCHLQFCKKLYDFLKYMTLTLNCVLINEVDQCTYMHLTAKAEKFTTC